MTESYEYIIVGAGISGLSLANELLAQGVSKEEILVLEANKRPGGLIKTDQDSGYLCEWGPEGLRGKSEHTQRIFEYIDEEAIPVTEESSIRYVVKNGKLQKVPTGPLSAIFSGLIPFFGKLRLFKEPWVKKKEENETIAEFAERRFGKGILPIVNAFVSGVYGGNHEELSIKHAFPALKEFEIEHGSVIRGGMARAKQKKKEKKALQESGELSEEEPVEKPPFLYSTNTGMQGLIEALASNVEVKYDTRVESVSNDGSYQLSTSNGDFTSENIVFAIGANGIHHIKFDLGEIVPKYEPIKEANVAVVSLGFEPDSFDQEIVGYGFLIPSTEDKFLLGSLFTSRLFPHHSPNGKVLLRCFVGGTRHPTRADKPDDELYDGVLKDLDDLLGRKKEPIYKSIQHHEGRGIPQMLLDHDKVIDWKEQMEINHKGLYFSGVGWTSIACDGLLEESKALASELLDSKAQKIKS